MDYRFNTTEKAKEYHKERLAFILIENKLYYLKNSEMSHWEFCKEKNISKDEFNKLLRGYYKDGSIYFYKGNFTYDDDLIKETMKYLVKIKEDCRLPKMKIYFGQIIPKKDEPWQGDYYYGKINDDNEIIKNS